MPPLQSPHHSTQGGGCPLLAVRVLACLFMVQLAAPTSTQLPEVQGAEVLVALAAERCL
jgi:hypothetical protein